MARNEQHTGSQRYVVHGDGNITGSTFTNSPVANVRGDHSSAENISVPGYRALEPWLEPAGDELARIRARLEANHDPWLSADREDALDAVITVQDDLPGLQADGPDAPRKVRRRLRELIGVLVPVAEVIGGVAALEQIVQHL